MNGHLIGLKVQREGPPSPSVVPEERPRAFAPYVVLSVVPAGGRPHGAVKIAKAPLAEVGVVSMLVSDGDREVRSFLNFEALADPDLRERARTLARPLPEAHATLGLLRQEGRVLVIYDAYHRVLTMLSENFRRQGLPDLELARGPIIDVYRTVSATARSKPTLDRVVRENLGLGAAETRPSSEDLWQRGDIAALIAFAREEVDQLDRVLQMGIRRGTLSLDGRRTQVDWDRRLRLAA